MLFPWDPFLFIIFRAVHYGEYLHGESQQDEQRSDSEPAGAENIGAEYFGVSGTATAYEDISEYHYAESGKNKENVFLGDGKFVHINNIIRHFSVKSIFLR